MSRFERYVSTVEDARERQNRWFFFGQDTWRITPKLTMNYGLRWEIYRPQEVNRPGNGGFIDLGTGEVKVAGENGVGLDLDVEGSLTNLAPRFGIAYQLSSNTVIRSGYGRGYNLGIFGSVFGHNVTQNLPVLGIQSMNPANSFDRVFTLADGPPSLDPTTILTSQPKGPNGHHLLPNGVTAFVIPPRLRLPTVDAWNLSIQRQLGNNLAAEIAYVGTKGTHVFAGNGGDYDPNQASLIGYPTLNTNQRKPFFQKFGWSQNFRYYASDASNNYHGLQLKLEKRFSSGSSLLTHYTWSKTLDYTGTYYPHDARLAYGVSDFSRAKVFFVGGLWEVPVGKGKRYLSGASGFVEHLLGGWRFNGTFSWQSGLPFTPSYRDCGGDRDTGWCRPDLVGDFNHPDPSQFGWFLTADTPLIANGQVSGPWQRPQRGAFGSVGRNRLIGPDFQQWDMSFSKAFQINERLEAQLRAESFNFANRTNLANPNGCVDCPGVAGRIFGTFQGYVPRQWQMALKLLF